MTLQHKNTLRDTPRGTLQDDGAPPMQPGVTLFFLQFNADGVKGRNTNKPALLAVAVYGVAPVVPSVYQNTEEYSQYSQLHLHICLTDRAPSPHQRPRNMDLPPRHPFLLPPAPPHCSEEHESPTPPQISTPPPFSPSLVRPHRETVFDGPTTQEVRLSVLCSTSRG